jgi:hypothetical protein
MRSNESAAIINKPEETFSMTPLTLSIALGLLLSGSSGSFEQSFSRPIAQSTIQRTTGSTQLTPVSVQARYRTYANARFGYSISYPDGILIPQGEPDNGDGQVFRSRDGKAEMRVFGRYNVLNETLRSAFNASVAGEGGSGREVTYKLLKGNFYVVSGRQNGKIFYEKTMLKGDTFKTFMIEYDESESATYNPITSRVVRSFVG